MQFAATYAAGVFDTRTMLMGRQSAGVGFLRAALNHRVDRIYCYAANRGIAQVFAEDVGRLTPTPPEIHYIPWDQSARLALVGLLYRADPNLEPDAWKRQQDGAARAFSLCGVTHSLSSLRSISALTAVLHAPLYPWDAVVCTSTVAQDVYRSALEGEMEHLRRRVGATRFTLPQLPLIPLGVHAGDFVFSAEARAAARAELELAEGDIAVLFAGRLTFHGKAHHLPMVLGLEEAAKRTGRPVHLLLFGQFPNPKVAETVVTEAARLAPSVRLTHIDGALPEGATRAWAAADIFTSLSDNVQETFGLTPVEAMAAGLPVVVSDWNGYKDTVRDGVDGFRVPTLMPPAGCGIDLMDRHDMALDHYDMFIGNVAQLTAVDVGAVAEAYARLIASPALRRRMGDAGRARVAEQFDWAPVFRRYVALWEELAELRRSTPPMPGEEARAARPDRPDPFELYRSFPTAAVAADTRIRLRPGAKPADAAERRGLASVAFALAALPAERLSVELAGTLGSEWRTVGALVGAFPAVRHATLIRALVWLCKVGIAEFSDPADRPAWQATRDP